MTKARPAGDTPPQLLLACEGPQETGDRDGLSPLALPAQAGLEPPCAVVADGGDEHGDAVPACLAVGLTPSGAGPIPAAKKQRGLCSKAACRSAGATDPAQGPAGVWRTCRCDTVAPGRHRRYEATSAGKAWALKQAGPRSPAGRRMTRGVAEPRLEALAQRVRRRPAVLKRRQELVEPPWGTMHRWWDAGYGFRRGREQGQAELRVTVVAYHLRRVRNIVGMPRRRAALGCVGRRGGRAALAEGPAASVADRGTERTTKTRV